VVDTGFAVHIFRASATGRYFYTIGRDGKVSLIDLYEKQPKVVAEARVCLDARSVDVSKYKGPKGDFVDKLAVVGCYWPPQMVVLDAPSTSRSTRGRRGTSSTSWPSSAATGRRRWSCSTARPSSR
jgi:hypothetical protein